MADDWSDNDVVPEPIQESRGRGRGGGGGGNRGCFKCGESGHMSRECPTAGDSGGGDSRPRGCYKCGEEGHMSRECPNGGGDSGGRPPRTCHKCGEEGHISRECPSAGDSGGGDSRPRGCYKCGEEGHMSRECPNGGGDSGGRPPRTCHKCGEEGHMSRECPSAGDSGGGDSRPRGCYKCGEEGHMSRECPTAGESGGDSRPKGCFNCGEEGHMSRDCTNPRKEREPVEGEPPKERYITPEFLEGDAIFEERKKVFEGSGINFAKYNSIHFSVTGDNQVPSVNTFLELGLRPLILANLDKCGYSQPTPIQKHGSPQLMAGLHVMCCAQTGSGKTASFLLPIINKLLSNQDGISPPGTSPARPDALILAPTRELALQIGRESNMYHSGSIISTRVVYGGATIVSQKNSLQRSCNILVATAGRLKQFISEKIVDLSQVKYFVLDEADRMLDMGFMPDVKTIVESLPPKEERVSGMFSATFPSAIQVAAKEFLHNYVYVVIGIVGGACADVKQEFLQVEKAQKRKKIMEIIEETDKNTKILVFCASKKGADFLATFLSSKEVSCTSIHGDRLQSQREQALLEFTQGRRQVLVATAVAARGLDIPKVGLVVNYDLPSEIDEYVHRIGRTGRVGHTGRAISFYDDGQDAQIAATLVSILSGAGQEVPDFLNGTANGFGDDFEEGGFSSVDVRGGGATAAADDDDW